MSFVCVDSPPIPSLLPPLLSSPSSLFSLSSPLLSLLLQLASCDYHCAAVTTGGDLYTFGSKENGKLGRGRDSPSGSIGHVTQITRFLDSDEQTEWEDVKIGCVSNVVCE